MISISHWGLFPFIADFDQLDAYAEYIGCDAIWTGAYLLERGDVYEDWGDGPR